MIVASRFGWEAVAGPYRMNHAEFLYALQLIGEERWGTKHRAGLRREQKQAEANTEALERAHGRTGR